MLCCVLVLAHTSHAAHQMENLGRGLVAVRSSESDVFLSWRLLGIEPIDTLFNVYRSDNGGPALKINQSPIGDSTNFTDFDAPEGTDYRYQVRAIVSGERQSPSRSAPVINENASKAYLRLPLQKPQDGTSPDGSTYTYSANDCSVGDLDNDGDYEIVVKWDPSNSHDNAHDGYTGNVFLDAYELDGTQLWRIDLGVNIRAGAHYTQFIVYDLDGDGKAEIACKTADGTLSGTGEYIGDPEADYRSSVGRILDGPEFFSIFDGETGAVLATTDYVPARGSVSSWGDGYGNRVDRFLAGVAYLDGERPSVVMCRGYYTRAALVAWDWRNGELTERWTFDTGHTGGDYPAYRGQGAHSLTIGDLDADGFDEIVFGAAAIDHDGSGLHSTELGHGDALHLSDMDPNNPGLEIWMVHETPSAYGDNGSELRKASTGELLYGVSGEGADVGRGVAADIDPRYLGYETWASRGGLHNATGTEVSSRRPSSMNFLCYWDGDLLREILDGTTISKWDWENERLNPILVGENVASNNSTKATPCLSADLFGDWREEVVWRETDSAALRIYSTTIPTNHRFHTLMHDPQYRVAIAWQNVGYNQPPHPGFYLGEGMTPQAAPELELVGDGVPTSQLPVSERFSAWLASNNFPTDSDPFHDPDGNGLPLLIDYAFENLADGKPFGLESEDFPSPLLQISTPRDEFDYVIQSTMDAGDWTTEAAILGGNQTVAYPLSETRDTLFRIAINGAEHYNALPTIEITSPANGESFEQGTNIPFTISASDDDGSVSSVEYILNGDTFLQLDAAPFTTNWEAEGEGTQELRAIATDDQGSNGYSATVTFYVVSTQSSDGDLYPAETATTTGGIQENTNSGFNGSGYFNFDVSDSVLTFENVNGASGGSATLKFRFALGADASRTGVLTINDVDQSITFQPTGAWTTWSQQEVIVSLNTGTANTISLSSNGNDLANIDEMLVVPSE